MSPIKLVATDMDGTLLNHQLEIPARTKAAIASARARGVQVVIATGRMYQSAAPFARELGLEGMPLVAYNGALVREFPSGRTIYHEPVPLDVGLELASFCESWGYYLQAYVDDELYVAELNETARQYAAIARVPVHAVGPLSLWLDKPSTKFLLIDTAERIEQIRQVLEARFGDQLVFAQSYPTFLEVVSRKVSKGAALAAVAASLGVSREEVVAIGDSINDIPMLEWAGTGVAIRHAPEEVRRVASFTTVSGAGEGVGEALERLGLA
jgi:Cof subfamily protein (haloacid dehalogenase superfamily)